MAEQEAVRIVLTPEQRELVRRASGQSVDAIEMAPDETKHGEGPVRFVWRLSKATGIPRLTWSDGEETPPTQTQP